MTQSYSLISNENR